LHFFADFFGDFLHFLGDFFGDGLFSFSSDSSEQLSRDAPLIGHPDPIS